MTAVMVPTVLQVEEFKGVPVEPEMVLDPNGRLMLFPSLRGKGYFRVSIGPTAATIQPQGWVGIIPINDRLTIEVVPRVPLANLSNLLQLSGVAPTALANAYRLYEAEGQLYPSLAGVYAAGLRAQIDTIIDLGFLKTYERREELTSFPRGRIEMARTIQRAAARGINHRVAVTWFQRSVDNPVNQCLRYAVWRLWQYAAQVAESLSKRQARRIAQDLNYCEQQLQGVALDLTERFLTDFQVTGRASLPPLRAYYREALDLALTVIGRRALLLERHGAHLRLPSLVVDMSKAFEAYARAVLVRASREAAWPAAVLDGNQQPPAGGAGVLFERGVEVSVTPDIVVRTGVPGDYRFPVVLDAKYKPAEGLPGRDDLNQVIAYGLAYRSPQVVLVQPRDHRRRLPSGLRLLGTIGGIEVSQYVMDLAATDIHAEEAAFAAAVRRLADVAA